MSTEMSVQVALRERLLFEGRGSGGLTVRLDASAPLGDAAGMSPLELVLIALASSAGQEVLELLRQEGQTVQKLEVCAHSQHQDDPPGAFANITLEFACHGSEIECEAVERAIELASLRFCPVWSMLEQSTWISATYRVLNDPEPAPAET